MGLFLPQKLNEFSSPDHKLFIPAT